MLAKSLGWRQYHANPASRWLFRARWVSKPEEENAENAENVGNDVPGNGENAGHVAKNARNVNFANLVAENDGQVAETAENVNVGNVVTGNVAIQG